MSQQERKKSLNIIITGASSGIGESIALALAKDGHQIFLIGRNYERLEKVVSKIKESNSRTFHATGDVGNSKDVERIFDLVKAVYDDQIDVLIANAGVGFFGNIEDLTEEQYDAQFDTNVKGVFLWLRKVLPFMKEQNSGQIIVMSSNMGLMTGARASLYAGTKHAIQAMVGALRDELKDTNIKAATINPGSVNTPWFDGKDVDRSKMLSTEDIVAICRLILYQSETSNIDHVHVLPSKR